MRQAVDQIVNTLAEVDQMADPQLSPRLPLLVGSQGFDNAHSWLVKGLIPEDSVTTIYGQSGSFKSFLALSLCCHIATGKEWDGRKVTQGSVLYVVGEGGNGVPRRIRGWELLFNGGEPVSNLYRVQGPVFPADRKQVNDVVNDCQYIEEQTGEPVRLIVLDTLARCYGGSDENSAKDMGAFVAGCDRIKQQTKATVLVVHHSGKNEEAGARGSSALKGALDIELLVKREGTHNALVLTGTKAKDSEQPPALAYDLTPVKTHDDEDGDPVNTLVLIPEGREPNSKQPAKPLTPAQQTVWQAIRSRNAKGEPATFALVGDDFVAQGGQRKNYGRVVNQLVKHGVVERTEKDYFVFTSSEVKGEV